MPSGLPQWLSSRDSTCNAGAQETQVQFLHQEDPLEKSLATHSSIFAWKIPWTEAGYSPWGGKELYMTEVI